MERLRRGCGSSTGQPSALPRVVTQCWRINNRAQDKASEPACCSLLPRSTEPSVGQCQPAPALLAVVPRLHGILGARCFCFFLAESFWTACDAYLVPTWQENTQTVSPSIPEADMGSVFCISCLLTAYEESQRTEHAHSACCAAGLRFWLLCLSLDTLILSNYKGF